MKYILIALAMSAAMGCGGDPVQRIDEPETATAQEVEKPCADKPIGAPCESPGFNSGSCNAGVCVGYNDCAKMSNGDVCGGAVSDGYYGRCNESGCAWKDYQCWARPNGDACSGGLKGGSCQTEECCYLCVDTSGACVSVHNPDGSTIQGGVPCP